LKAVARWLSRRGVSSVRRALFWTAGIPIYLQVHHRCTEVERPAICRPLSNAKDLTTSETALTEAEDICITRGILVGVIESLQVAWNIGGVVVDGRLFLRNRHHQLPSRLESS